jgi:plastocyanin
MTPGPYAVGRAIVCATIAAASACGGGGGGTPPTPVPSPNPNVITITAAGVVTPKQLTVSQGARVLFVNSDSRRHNMASDQHPDHLECPAINDVGVLAPGQQRETGNLVTVRTCGYHDHDDSDNTNLKGSIVIR